MATLGYDDIYEIGDEVHVSNSGVVIETGLNYVVLELDASGHEVQFSDNDGWQIE